MKKRTQQKYDIYENVVDPTYIDAWQESLTGNQNTKNSYLQGLMSYLAFLQNLKIQLKDVRRFAVEDFKKALTKAGFKPSTISLYLAGIRSFYRFASQHYGIIDVASKVEGANSNARIKSEALPHDLALQLLHSIDTTEIAGQRDFAIINLMLRASVTTSQISNALISDLSPQPEGFILTVQGKGKAGKPRRIRLGSGSMNPIENYLENRGAESLSEPLFASLSDRNSGKALTPASVSRMVKQRMEGAGIDTKRFNSHSLRKPS